MIALWIQSEKTVCRRAGPFQVKILVAGINEVQLGLFRIAAKWVVGFQIVEVLLGFVEVARVHRIAGIFVIGLFRQYFFLLIVRCAGTDE